ncbi:PAP2-domain-containing protein [Mycena filopes]|nr:PAP2-domain-containing protein [Mycena filopes]
MASYGPQASLDLTHVLYDDSSHFSLALALVTLTPILLMPAYAVLAIQTREFVIIVMWIGQLAGEVLNLVLKHAIKQDRPSYSAANGYGFPSSHSQYMGYFASFLMMHLYFRHRFATTGYKTLDLAFRAALYAGLAAWAFVVAYSRFYLRYHSIAQILWGFGIGVVLGVSVYTVCEILPRRHPKSIFGLVKTSLVENPVSTWLQIRDGWDIWADGGREVEWLRWKAEWDRRHRISSDKKAS